MPGKTNGFANWAKRKKISSDDFAREVALIILKSMHENVEPVFTAEQDRFKAVGYRLLYFENIIRKKRDAAGYELTKHGRYLYEKYGLVLFAKYSYHNVPSQYETVQRRAAKA